MTDSMASYKGEDAYNRGHERSDNPYQKGTTEFEAWNLGYTKAAQREEFKDLMGWV